MSGTVACIMVKIRKNDLNQTKSFDGKKVRKYLDWGYLHHRNPRNEDETSDCRCEPVELEDKYIGVFVNYDGYPSVTGKALKLDFNDYDSALNLCLGGNISAITNRIDEIKKWIDKNDIEWAENTKWFDGLQHYANRSIKHGGSIEWKHIKPLQGKSISNVIHKFWSPRFCYVFDEDKGGWKSYKVFGSKKGLKFIEVEKCSRNC